MNRGILKKSIALVMATVMVFSMAGCGKKGGGSSSKKEKKEDTKEMVFASTDLVLEGVEGDIGTFSVQGDKIYFNTYEWIEKGGSKGDSEKQQKSLLKKNPQKKLPKRNQRKKVPRRVILKK